MHFPMALLSDLCEINIGRTPSRSVQKYWGAGAPWLSIADMNQGRNISVTKEQITEYGIRDANMRLVPKGALLLSFKLSIGKVSIAQIPLYTNEAIAALPIKNRERILPDYLYWCLKTIDLTAGQDRAAMGLTLNKAKLAQVNIPLPSMEVQRRIVAILDKADALRAMRRDALIKLDSLTRSIFIEMFGDPLSNPKGWIKESAGEIGEIITGNTPSRGNSENYGNGIEWIKSDNINTPHYYLTEAVEQLSPTGKAISRTAPAGAILITCIAGSPDCIGNAAMANREVAFNQQINAFVPRTGNPHFYYAQIVVGKKLIQEASTGGMKGMVSKGRFGKINFIVPPCDLQHEFARRVTKVGSLAVAQHASLAALDNLFVSLQHRAFQGRL